MRGRLAAVAFALIGLVAGTAEAGHGGGGSHSGGGHSHASGGSHVSGGGGGGGGQGGGRSWIGAKPPSSFKPTFADSREVRGGARPSSASSTIGFVRGSPTVAGGPPELPRPWPGRHTAQPAAGDSASNAASNPAVVFFKALGEFALYTLLEPGYDDEEVDVDVDIEVVPDRAEPAVDPCEQCPLDAACGMCVGYGGYACQDNPSRELDRCVSTAPRGVEPIAN